MPATQRQAEHRRSRSRNGIIQSAAENEQIEFLGRRTDGRSCLVIVLGRFLGQTALRFFFKITLRRHDIADHIPFVPQPQKLPVILGPDEVARLLAAARGPKYKAALSVAYGAGLRASEIRSLKVTDIDSERMMIRVEQGKGRKDRYVMLSPHLLELLRTWWKVQRPRGYLFPGQDRINPLTLRQLDRACLEAARLAGINKRVTPHLLRHSFATHLLERKVDIRVIQALLGHAKLDTTAIYTRVATKTIQEVTSPLDSARPFHCKRRSKS